MKVGQLHRQGAVGLVFALDASHRICYAPYIYARRHHIGQHLVFTQIEEGAAALPQIVDKLAFAFLHTLKAAEAL